jgi:tetratricopeptide (TPR) repeat protein
MGPPDVPGPDRLALLQQLVQRNPSDPFPRYGLAMELKRLGRLEEACAAFEQLVEGRPDYVPTYLMFGGLLRDLGRRDEAALLLDRGVDAARAAGDDHAASELRAALAELA